MSTQWIDQAYVALEVELVDFLSDGGQLAVIKAPPGSGKTFTLIEVLSSLTGRGFRIAVAAQTNNQADDICKRLAKDHPEVAVARYASRALQPDNDFPSAVLWIDEGPQLPSYPGVTVATTAKWSLTDLSVPYDLLAVDEAWQMSWADLMQCALISSRFLMIGDPGQISPVVPVDVRRWETAPRAPHRSAPDVVLGEPAFQDVLLTASLPACRRLPCESVPFIRPFYDFEFAAYLEPGARGVYLPAQHPIATMLPSGLPVALTLPTPPHGPPIDVDFELATAVSTVVKELLGGGAVLRIGECERPLHPSDLGVTSSHRDMNSALTSSLGSLANAIRVDTPERWQGLERPVMVAVHPLSSTASPSSFDLETGRLCVMASRHQAAMLLFSRDHVGQTLMDYVPKAEQAPGCEDIIGRGHDAHLKFWTRLEQLDRVVKLN